MEQLETLILSQITLVLLIATIFLTLYVRRMKKTILRLQAMLVDYKEEISGESFIRYLQLSVDDTTAHCSQETIDLIPNSPIEDQAISLRYHALSSELQLVQTYNSRLSDWRVAIEPYQSIAERYNTYIQSIPEKVEAKFKTQVADMEKDYQRVSAEVEAAQKELKGLKPISSFFNQPFEEDTDNTEIELSLHNALISLCDTIDDPAKLREVIYLIHESFHQGDSQPVEVPTTQTANDDTPPQPARHTQALTNIINEQNKLIQSLRQQLSGTDSNELIDELDVLEHNFKAAEEQIEQLENKIEALRLQHNNTDNPANQYDEDEMHNLIEQFTEESAELVERLAMLQNQNKQLMNENEEMRDQIEANTGSEDDSETPPLVTGLKMKISAQADEFVRLQTNFKQMEEKYLSLYEKNKCDPSIDSTSSAEL